MNLGSTATGQTKLTEEFLEQHGILGMKWGVRRYQNKDGTRTPAGKKRYDGDGNAGSKSSTSNAKTTVRTRLSDVSDDQLRKMINRIEMEKKYASLTKKEKSAGEKFITSVLTDAARKTASTYVSRAMTNTIDELLNQKKKK